MDHSLFDLYYDSFIVLDSEMKVIYANEAAALLFGTSVRRLMSKKKNFIDQVQFNPEIPALKNILEVDEPTPVREVEFESSTGKTGKGQVTIQQNPQEKGEWIVYIRDVTLEETLQKKYRAELDQKEEVIEDLKKARNELENYSKNLEQMVEERTAEIQKLHQLQTAMLNSLGQGFLVFDEKGQCYPTYSKACEEILETVPSDKNVWDVLKLGEDKVEGFKKWCQAAFSEMLPFKDLAPLGPQEFEHKDDKHIHLEYHPMRVDERIEGIVLVASDMTREIQAQEEAQRERAHAEMIMAAIRNKKQLGSFIRDTRNFLAELKKELGQEQPDVELLFRIVHTLKGGAASFSISSMVDVTHGYEARLAQATDASAEERQPVIEELRIGFGAIEEAFQGFLEQNRDILGPTVFDSQRYVELPVDRFQNFVDRIKDNNLRSEFNRQFIMEPIGGHFRYYEEIVEQVAEQLGKQVEPIKFSGEDTLIIPEVYTELFATFIHAFRNAVDHGIESPGARQENGKDPAGRIEVSFTKTADDLIISVQDNGGGIDPERIRQKLTSSGVTSVENETDEEVIQHVFDSQLSTRDEATELSGRGVGMDAIKTAAEKLGGQAHVSSTVGKGTQLVVKVPYVRELALQKLAA